ncbi:MAG: MGMT family protein [Planctomycetota bacterium]
MKKTRKSWREKLAQSKGLPKTLVIPAPKEVDEFMRQVPPGKLTTINEIRSALARKHGTDMACPMTTGIFAWIAAHAAVEAAAAGEQHTTPYWRTLKTGGELNPKYPGGLAGQKKLLEAEGHRIEKKGKAQVVAEYEKALCALGKQN